MDNRPIGVFDSGFGGLTVLKEIKRILPNESIVYFGDNGRAPYGTKSREVVQRFTFQNTRFLCNQGVKMLVIACNTASAYTLEQLKDSYTIPIIEVVKPGAAAAVRKSNNGRIGIIGTAATISSGVYDKAIKALDSSIETYSKACPLFVNLVEEGWWDNDIARLTTMEYLKTFEETRIDTLILGCTHYPLLEPVISQVIGTVTGQPVSLVSSARAVAKIVKEELERCDMAAETLSFGEANKDRNRIGIDLKPQYRYYTSDSVEKFADLGSRILNESITNIEKADIEKF